MTDTMALTGSKSDATASRGRVAAGTAVGIGLVLLANTAVYLAADAGAPVEVVTGWEPDGAELRLGDVLGAAVTWTAIGGAGLWFLERFRADGFRLWTFLAAAIAVVSIIPLFRLDIDAASLVALSAMHLVVGATAIGGHALVRVRR